MGNATSHRHAGAPTGKVILSNGTIHEYEPPMTAAELMLDHPRHVVVEVPHKVCAGGGAVKVSTAKPLPADKKLERNKLYLMVPMSKGRKTTMSLEEIQKTLMIANRKHALNLNSTMFLSSLTGILPLLVRYVNMVNRKERRIEEKTLDERKGKTESLMEEMWEEKPEFMWLSRTVSGKGWRPSLDTIKEKGVK